ncbi:MAG TPA: hypothetical protein VM327_05055 [Candidatus Thermoplasmatota archaeon]|nr:hypothetical protein [Candidatus Thermoplasmatota archaeon]
MPPLAQAQVRRTDALSTVVHLYERHGFPSQFVASAGGNVRCLACERDHPARWVPLLALHHLERPGHRGQREPIALAAVECPACEERGTLTLPLGDAARIEVRLVLELLDDRRDEAMVGLAPRIVA